jgi:hypothetical protein
MAITVGICSVGYGVGMGVSARLSHLESKLMVNINQRTRGNFEAGMSYELRWDVRQ